MNIIPTVDNRDSIERLSEIWAEPDAEALKRARAMAELDEIERWQEDAAARADGQI